METNQLTVGCAADDTVLEQARDILRRRAATCYRTDGKKLTQEDVSREVKQLLALELAGLDRERFAAAFLGPDGRLLGIETLYMGTSIEVAAPPREIARAGLRYNATYVAVAHNHINGDRRPSDADEQSTLHMCAVLGALDMKLIAAYVVAGPDASDVVEIKPPKRVEKTGDEYLDALLDSLKKML